MGELNTREVVWYLYCGHQNMPHEIIDMTTAKTCEYFDDVSWIK
jgi:hypothetical protein